MIKQTKERNEIISFLLDSSKKENANFTDNLPIANNNYVLEQVLRQLKLDDDHIHISEAAYEKLENYDLSKGITRYLYNANLTIKLIGKSKGIKFNSEFIVEHVVPIKEIKIELKKYPNKLSNNRINEIIDKIHICILTNTEDEKLRKNGFSTKRGIDYHTIIKTGAYKLSGIIVKDKNIFSYFKR